MSVLVVDKATGPTSFAVCKKVRWALARLWERPLRSVKVGHGGTLDPMASGVLPICVGEATKLAPFLLDADKEYEATVRFGAETDTLDAEGEIVATAPVEGLTAAAVEAALTAFRGAIDQVPPMYSALKRHGRPLYAYARAGEEVERAARRVTVHALTLEGFEPPDRARLRVRCSKGTYVRVLAADLGRALGPGAHLVALRRLVSGPFHLGQAQTLEALVTAIEGRAPLPFVSLGDALAHLPAVTASEAVANALRWGQAQLWSVLSHGPLERIRVVAASGVLVAVVEPGEGGTVRTLRVFNDPKSGP